MSFDPPRPVGIPSSGLRRLLVGFLGLLAVQGCGDAPPPPPETIPAEVFVDVYVELRAAVLQGDDAVITPAERDAVLERYGVTEEDLLTFVDVHGRDLPMMREVWEEVDRRLAEWGRAG